MSLRQRLDADRRLLGTFQTFDTPMVTERLGHAGVDLVVLDQEHGPLTAETTLQCCMAADCADVAPVVRVRQNDPAEIQRALDAGAAGVQVPQVETAADAQAAVEAARFAPVGDRGFSRYVRAGTYDGGEDYAREQNERTAVILQVEGERGLENLASILAVDGFDAVFLGPYDIAASLDVPGRPRADRVTTRIEAACDAAREAGVVVGVYADDVDGASRWFDAGATVVECSLAAEFLGQAVTDVVEELDATAET